MAKLLFVEDDLDLGGRVHEWLKFEQYSVECLTDGDEASHHLKLYEYDLIILDWDLPKKTGLELCQEFRNRGGTAPILMLTGKSEITEKEAGLDAGADDYLTKPFHLKELSARIRALLRRPAGFSGNTLKFGDFELDPASHCLKVKGNDISLLPKEFALLEFFMRHPHEVFSPEALLNRIWHADSEACADTIYTYIKTLRKKLSLHSSSSLIKTIHGVGYKLEPQEKLS